MKILCDAGIVTGRKDGKWTYYSFNQEGIANARSILQQITTLNLQAKDECCFK